MKTVIFEITDTEFELFTRIKEIVQKDLEKEVDVGVILTSFINYISLEISNNPFKVMFLRSLIDLSFKQRKIEKEEESDDSK